MSYRPDPDLDFLKDVPFADLDPLVEILIKDTDGSKRWAGSLASDPRFKKHYPEHDKYWDLVAAEIQLFGGNTLANTARGSQGVLYREVLTDVCEKMKVNFSSKASVERIEQNLLVKIMTDAMEKMPLEEIKQFVDEMGLKTTNYTAQGLVIALQAAIRVAGFPAYQLAVIVANAVAKTIIGRGLSFAAGSTLTRTMGIFAGPIGLALTGAWTVVDIAGPAYRVTIPAAIQVAYLRQKQKYENQ